MKVVRLTRIATGRIIYINQDEIAFWTDRGSQGGANIALRGYSDMETVTESPEEVLAQIEGVK